MKTEINRTVVALPARIPCTKELLGVLTNLKIKDETYEDVIRRLIETVNLHRKVDIDMQTFTKKNTLAREAREARVASMGLGPLVSQCCGAPYREEYGLHCPNCGDGTGWELNAREETEYGGNS